MKLNLAFIKELFAGIDPNCTATLHSFAGDPSVNVRGQWYAMPWKQGKPLPTLNPFANNYVCVSSFHPDVAGEYYRRKVQFAALHCVMIDDLGTKLPLSDLKLEPTWLIETSPGNFQAWLFLDEPIRELLLAEVLIDQMIEAGITADADPGMRGVTRVGRLPEGANGKAKYKAQDGAVWRQRVKSRSEARYSAAQIARAYSLDLTINKRPPPAPPRTGIDTERAMAIQWLKVLGVWVKELRESYHEIKCPWQHLHSDGAATGTYYMEPLAENSWQGGFICHHGHCGERDINDLIGWIRARKDAITPDEANNVN